MRGRSNENISRSDGRTELPERIPPPLLLFKVVDSCATLESEIHAHGLSAWHPHDWTLHSTFDLGGNTWNSPHTQLWGRGRKNFRPEGVVCYATGISSSWSISTNRPSAIQGTCYRLSLFLASTPLHRCYLNRSNQDVYVDRAKHISFHTVVRGPDRLSDGVYPLYE